MNFFILSLVSVVVFLGSGTCYTIVQNSADEKSSNVRGGPVEDIYHHLVSLNCRNNRVCSGALITPRHVLTTAHCVKIMRSSNYCTIQMYRKRDSGSTYEDVGGMYAKIESATLHPLYSPNSEKYERPAEHDIGVIKLDDGFPLDDESYKMLRPIALIPYPPRNNEVISVSGFGKIDKFNYIESSKSKTYSNRLLTYEECTERISPARVFSTDICDSGRTYQGTWKGDSGGLVVNGDGYLIGIVSRGFHNGTDDDQALNIFASVYHHKNFITECLLL